MVTKVCKVCGRQFKAQRNNACYCSGICRIANRGGSMGKHGCKDQLSIYDISKDAMEIHRDVYLLVDNSIYELPLCVCDSVEELSDLTGDDVGTINDMIAKAEKRKGKSKYLKVRI